jgi:hypothetical protein
MFSRGPNFRRGAMAKFGPGVEIGGGGEISWDTGRIVVCICLWYACALSLFTAVDAYILFVNYLVELVTTIDLRHISYRIDSVFVWHNSDVIRLCSGYCLRSKFPEMYSHKYLFRFCVYTVPNKHLSGRYNFKLVSFRRRRKTCTDK